MDDTASYVEDRLDDGVFRIDRGIYTQPDIFAAEMDRVFGKVWVYLCHESQVAEYGDLLRDRYRPAAGLLSSGRKMAGSARSSTPVRIAARS